MNIEFRKSFEKDLLEILDANLLPIIQEVIERVEQAEKLSEVSNLKKLKGEADYYRIRVGDYRIFQSHLLRQRQFLLPLNVDGFKEILDQPEIIDSAIALLQIALTSHRKSRFTVHTPHYDGRSL